MKLVEKLQEELFELKMVSEDLRIQLAEVNDDRSSYVILSMFFSIF